MSERTILITGVNGFIGSHVARQLSRNWRVLGIGTGSIDIHAVTDKYCQLILPDADIESLLHTEKPTACLHFAGSASVGHSLEHPAYDFQAGPVALFQLLDSIRKAAPDCTIFFPSSAAVYGNPKTLPISEDSPIAPISPYGHHKFISERILHEFNTIFGLKTVVLRLFSCYGPGLRKQLLWDVCEKIRQGTLHLFGTGNETRDFIHVDDVARAIDHMLEQNIQSGTFNLAGGKQIPIKQIVELLIAASPNPEIRAQFNQQSRPGDPLYWQADILRLVQTGFTPRIPLEQGVAQYATWHSEQVHERS